MRANITKVPVMKTVLLDFIPVFKYKKFSVFSLYISQVFYALKKKSEVKLCHVSHLSMTGTLAEHSDCYGSEETGMVKLLSRAASCSKCGMARYQHIIKPLANTHSLTAQSPSVFKPQCPRLSGVFSLGLYPDKPSSKRWLFIHHNEAQVWEVSLAKVPLKFAKNWCYRVLKTGQVPVCSPHH